MAKRKDRWSLFKIFLLVLTLTSFVVSSVFIVAGMSAYAILHSATLNNHNFIGAGFFVLGLALLFSFMRVK